MTVQEVWEKAKELQFFPEIQKDIALYVDMLESLRQDDAKVLCDSSTALLLQLKSWPLYLLAAVDEDEGKKLLSGLEPDEDGNIFVVVRGANLYSCAAEQGFDRPRLCYQTYYEKTEPVMYHTDLEIRHPDKKDYRTIAETYTLPMSEEEVYASIERPEFMAGYLNGELAGFVGLHSEGSVGMLHVMDKYRGRGYALVLSAHMINDRLAAGAFPYGQVFTDNEASIALQKKLGLTFSNDYICWLWKIKKECC